MKTALPEQFVAGDWRSGFRRLGGRIRRRSEISAEDKTRQGFTLIELVASSLLTVILMTAILTALTSCFQETRQLRVEQSRHPSLWLLQEQIRRDVQNAQGMQIGPNSLVLFGYLATDNFSQIPTLKRALVTYQLQGLGQNTVLMRDEQPIGGIVAAAPKREIVWKGVSRLGAQKLGGAVVMAEDLVWGLPQDTGGLPALPPAVRIMLWDDSQRILFRDTILHHQEL